MQTSVRSRSKLESSIPLSFPFDHSLPPALHRTTNANENRLRPHLHYLIQWTCLPKTLRRGQPLPAAPRPPRSPPPSPPAALSPPLPLSRVLGTAKPLELARRRTLEWTRALERRTRAGSGGGGGRLRRTVTGALSEMTGYGRVLTSLYAGSFLSGDRLIFVRAISSTDLRGRGEDRSQPVRRRRLLQGRSLSLSTLTEADCLFRDVLKQELFGPETNLTPTRLASLSAIPSPFDQLSPLPPLFPFSSSSSVSSIAGPENAISPISPPSQARLQQPSPQRPCPFPATPSKVLDGPHF